MSIKIAYNPYKEEFRFWENGKELSRKNSLVEATAGKRLQTVLFPSKNWTGLAAALAEQFNSREIKVEFAGREVDFEDLKAALEDYNNNKGSHPHFVVIKPNHFAANDSELRKKLDRLVESFYRPDNPIPELRHATELRENYRKNMNGIFKMAVVATMSSGKSTMINALLGQDLLPARNEPTTAKITRIFDRDSATDYTVQAKDRNETPLGKIEPANPDLLEKLNESKSVYYIDLYGNIPGVSSETLRLCIEDTPGPSNSDKGSHHQEITYNVIQDKKEQRLILYVMDATKPRDDSDAKLLDDIAQEIRKSGKEAQDRFIFVLNKADSSDERHDGPLSEFMKRQQKYLEDHHIVSSQIIPLSAQGAKLLRMRENGVNLDRKAAAQLVVSLCSELDEAAILTPSCRRKLDDMKASATKALAEAQKRNDPDAEEKAQYTLDQIATGIIGLELTIDEYLKKYAYPQKIRHATVNFQENLEEKKMLANLESDLRNNQALAEEFRRNMQSIEGKRRDLAQKRKELEDKTYDLKFPENLFDEIELDFAFEIESLIKKYSYKAEQCGKKSTPRQRELLFQEIQSMRNHIFEEMKTTCTQILEKQEKEDFDELLTEYKQAMTKLEKNFSFGEFDMGQTDSIRELHRSLDNFQLQTIVYDKQSYGRSHIETEERIRERKNPAKEGFWGFFKFWEPEYLKQTYTVPVEIDDGINYEKLAKKIQEDSNTARAELISLIKNFAEAQYRRGREYCLTQLDLFESAIHEKTEALQQLLKKSTQNWQERDELFTRMEWLQKKTDELYQILELKY